MTNITINAKVNAIEITKAFSVKAAKFGTEEYNELKAARADFPTYKVVVRKVTAKKESFKGLDYKYMEKYISAHDVDGAIMKEFQDLRGESESALDAMAVTLSYGEIKAWFLKKFPEIEAFHQRRSALVA